MDIEKVKEFIKILEQSDLKKLTIREKDSELTLEKEDTHQVHSVSVPAAAPSVHQTAQPASQEKAPEQKAGNFITSPMVGTFYKRPGPDQKNFVEVGDKVEKDTVVCIIEAMKVMNEVKAGQSGVVQEILIEDAHPVEFGTNLIRIV